LSDYFHGILEMKADETTHLLARPELAEINPELENVDAAEAGKPNRKFAPWQIGALFGK
jgi:hypothetical protein